MRNTLAVTASLFVLFAIPSASFAAPVDVRIERLAARDFGEKGAKSVEWSVTVTAPRVTSPLKVTVVITNVADTDKGPPNAKTETHELTLDSRDTQELFAVTWGPRPTVRTQMERVAEEGARRKAQQRPDASAGNARGGAGPGAARPAPRQPARSAPRARKAPAKRPTPEQKPSQR